MHSIDDMPHVMGDDGQFHAQDEAVDLSGTPREAWLALAFFWLLGLTVFYQFFTRYVLNDSAAWTEEIARYLLIATVFIGASIGVAKNNHIQVDFFYRYMPPGMGRAMATVVDVLRIAFFGAAVVLTIQMMTKLGQSARMTLVDLPMNVVYGVCLAGFVFMLLRSLWVARVHLRRGYTVLERVESTMEDDLSVPPRQALQKT
ncbi:TRAP transporter small permease [Ramlibacter sp. RBP-2]|uniref:TRAP transporter small permease protein n=1 Tax=Ramlibacter lithotrophicus TaxID=2606681 RepID=A0A7X6I6H5_9BURK|nr:TRAP transporter small permease [Ramlibacter lithotrophicus]NKE66381.1 TRAP transporter small permease [Ramlibacter lithotrophicus]